MQDLMKVKTRATKRLGRGYGSGKGGHTSSRGTKGQKARTHIHILFEGLKVRKSLLSRLPFKRGKDKFKPSVKPLSFNLSDFSEVAASTTIDTKFLAENGYATLRALKKQGAKVLGNGEISTKLIFSQIMVSKSAKDKIEKAGGSVQ